MDSKKVLKNVLFLSIAMLVIFCISIFVFDKKMVNAKETECEEVIYSVPINTGKKSWMTYSAITNKNTKQYDLKQYAIADNNGLYKIDDAFVVALGTYYGTNIGDIYSIVLDTNYTFRVILGDVKSNNHTCVNNQITISNNCIMEFIVNTEKLNKDAKRSGNISSISGFEGKITNVQKIGNFYDQLKDEELGRCEETIIVHERRADNSVGKLLGIYDKRKFDETKYNVDEIFIFEINAKG